MPGINSFDDLSSSVEDVFDHDLLCCFLLPEVNTIKVQVARVIIVGVEKKVYLRQVEPCPF